MIIGILYPMNAGSKKIIGNVRQERTFPMNTGFYLGVVFQPLRHVRNSTAGGDI